LRNSQIPLFTQREVLWGGSGKVAAKNKNKDFLGDRNGGNLRGNLKRLGEKKRRLKARKLFQPASLKCKGC